MPPPRFRLLVITDRRAAFGGDGADPDGALVAAVAAALAGSPPGLTAVMLREKDLCGRALLGLAGRLREVTRDAGAPLLVNERVDVAAACGADGVHLPAAGLPPEVARTLLGPDALVGVSTHAADEVHRAADGGADYVTFGPIYETPSKRGLLPPTGPGALSDLGERLPVYGLGGITPGQTAAVRAAGAFGVACIRAVVGARDPGAAVRAFLAGAR
jgi:thiamine-phosphate pyrophosphorylase